MATTPVLGITKHADGTHGVTVANRAYALLEVLLTSVKDRDLTAPPGSESEGDAYIVGASATGDWTGRDDDVAVFEGGVYQYVTPSQGTRIWIDDENVEVVWSGSAWVAHCGHQTLTDAATITWDAGIGAGAQVTLTASRTLAAPTNMIAGKRYTILVIQDGVGSHLLTWNAVFNWAGGGVPTLSTGASAVDLFEFYYDGTTLQEVARGLNQS